MLSGQVITEEKTGLKLRVLQSSGYRILDTAASRAVKNWQFVPGWQGDNATDMWVQVPVRFTLQ